MTEHVLAKTIDGNIVRYSCPNCGAVIELHEHVINMFIKNNTPYFCEDCGEPIKFN